MNEIIMSEDVIQVIKSFMACNKGDESTDNILLAVGSELLDVSIDTFVEILSNTK